MELLELLVPAFVFAVGLPSIVVSLTPVKKPVPCCAIGSLLRE